MLSANRCSSSGDGLTTHTRCCCTLKCTCTWARACHTRGVRLAGAFFPDKDAGRSCGGKTRRRQTGLISRVPPSKEKRKSSTTGTRRQKAHWYRRWHPGGSCTHHVTRSRLRWKGTLSGEAGVWWCVFHPAGKRWVKKVGGGEEEEACRFPPNYNVDDCCCVRAGCLNSSLRFATKNWKKNLWMFKC